MKQEIPIRMDSKTSEDEIFLITIRIEKKNIGDAWSVI